MGDDSSDDLDMLFIHLPVPFQRGDIVTVEDCELPEPRVLADLPHWWSDRYEDFISGKIGDGSDMIPYFYFINEDGVLIRDHSNPYDLWGLRYFTGELKGQDRFLKILSQYIKSEKHGNSIDWLINVFLKYRAEAESDELNRLFGR